MGNSGAKPLLFGTIKVTGADLYDEVRYVLRGYILTSCTSLFPIPNIPDVRVALHGGIGVKSSHLVG